LGDVVLEKLIEHRCLSSLGQSLAGSSHSAAKRGMTSGAFLAAGLL
jgi:hypothetical protein